MAIAFCGIIALVIVWLLSKSPQKTVAATPPLAYQSGGSGIFTGTAPGRTWPARRHHRMAECRQPDQLRKEFRYQPPRSDPHGRSFF